MYKNGHKLRLIQKGKTTGAITIQRVHEKETDGVEIGCDVDEISQEIANILQDKGADILVKKR